MGVKITAGPDDDELDVDAPDPDDEPDEDNDEPEGDGSTPQNDQATRIADLEQQLERLSAATSRNNRELARRRQVAKVMKQLGIDDLSAWLTERGIDPNTGQPAPRPTESVLDPIEEPDDSDGPDDAVDEPEPQPEPAAPATSKDDPEKQTLVKALRRTAVKAALKDLSFSGTIDRAMRVLEADGGLDALEIVDGEVAGAEELAKALREEFPEWFRRIPPPAPPTRRVGVDSGDRRTAPPRRRRWDEVVSDRMRGR